MNDYKDVDYLEEECDCYWEEEAVKEYDDPPPLGVLSRGPVWSCCPGVIYCQQADRLPTILRSLTLVECEELVEFLCGLDQVCDVSDCEFLTRDQFRQDMVFEALARGEREWALRHR